MLVLNATGAIFDTCGLLSKKDYCTNKMCSIGHSLQAKALSAVSPKGFLFYLYQKYMFDSCIPLNNEYT